MASGASLNQSLFEEQEMIMSSQLGIFPFHTNMSSSNFPLGFNQPLKTLSPPSPLTTLSDHSTLTKQKEDFPPHFSGLPQLLSLQRSASNHWAWGGLSDCMSMKRNGGEDHHHLGVAAVKMKKIKARRKVREPRFCFKTMSDVDVLDDGYKWRKYGQKVVKNTQHPRSYYRCTQDNCRVKKRVERLADDPRMVITSYEGRHIHSPSHDEEDSQGASQLGNFFW
ncbi:probable WRKY transcription factor 13 isoform X2 [Salvia hispanica]|uniref:probable WRKY transcription factor 13 isoform X2 n=1 Tax=Salvia hispanica TaxID=49212 RepID=UPI0020097B4D|nr:probable WRKY transcription factor 13 isoform X2 [Salvia hispanica]